MAIHIDLATVQRLLETRIETANDSTGPVTLRVVHTGESVPNAQDGEVWVSIAKVRCARQPRRTTNEEPRAEILVTLFVICPEATSADSAYAIGSAVEAVSRVLECATIDDSATSGHIIEMGATESEHELAGDFQQVVQAEISAAGEVRRITGTSSEERH